MPNRSSEARPSPDGDAVLFTSVRNEAAFLIEWIAFHKVIGFTRMVVYENESDDGTTQLLSALAQNGELEHLPFTPSAELPLQTFVAQLANEAGHFSDGDWVLWIDADEFLNVRCGDGTVHDLTAAAPGADAFVLNWRTMGAAPLPPWPPRLIHECYGLASKRTNWMNRGVKTLFRWGGAFSAMPEQGPHRPPITDLAQLDFSRCVNGSGTPLSPHGVNAIWLTGKDCLEAWCLDRNDWGFRLAQVNHYAVRDAASFLLRRRRGDAMGRADTLQDKAAQRYSRDYFRLRDRRDVEETSILRHEAATTAEMARLRALPGVAEAEAEALHRTAAMIAAIPPEEFAALTGEPLPEAAVPLSAT